MFSYVNFILLFTIPLFIGTKSKIKNFFISFALSIFIVLEIISFSFFNTAIGGNFIFYSINLNIFRIAATTKLLMFYFGIISFLAIFFLFYFLLNRLQINKYKKYFLICFIIFQVSPLGFVYSIFYDIIADYKVYYDYKKYSYNDMFKMVKGSDYVEFNNIEILDNKKLYKNLVMIYLESYDQSLLENKYTINYTSNINAASENGEYFKNIEQITGTVGTIPGIITSQCGVQYTSFFLFKNPYNDVNTDISFVCLSDVLHRAGYYQVYIGGADKKIVNKGNFLYSHRFDLVEDENSLISNNPELKNNLVEWGVSDYDIFNRAKDEFIKLSKGGRPFNLTILTTATHNYNGSYDKRCPNSTDRKLLNAVECTDYLVGDFIEFLKKQKNFNNTLVVILPDHRQYEANGLKDLINEDEKSLYTIILNSNIKATYDNKINYTDLAEVILKRLNVESNAVFLNKQENTDIIKNFIYKIHKNKY